MRRQGLPFVKLNYCIRDNRTCVQSWESPANTETIEPWMCNFLFSICWPCFCRLHCAFRSALEARFASKSALVSALHFQKGHCQWQDTEAFTVVRPCITWLAHCYHRDRSQIKTLKQSKWDQMLVYDLWSMVFIGLLPYSRVSVLSTLQGVVFPSPPEGTLSEVHSGAQRFGPPGLIATHGYLNSKLGFQDVSRVWKAGHLTPWPRFNLGLLGLIRSTALHRVCCKVMALASRISRRFLVISNQF